MENAFGFYNLPKALIMIHSCFNALVICNHAPTPGGGRGIAMEMSGGLTKVLLWQCVCVGGGGHGYK